MSTFHGPPMPPAIWWIRRDLRLTDNQALAAAITAGRSGEGRPSVVPVFILDPALLRAPIAGAKRVAFLLEGLRHLDASLRRVEGTLVIRAGDPTAELSALLAETGATAIFAERDPSPAARARDADVAAALPLELVDGLCVHSPGSVLKADGAPYVVFTPFSRAWQARKLPQPADIFWDLDCFSTPAGLVTLPIPDEPALPGGVPFEAGEAAARHYLEDFVGIEDAAATAGIRGYPLRRDLPAVAGTSRLSPYLRFGMISARAAAVRALDPALRGAGVEAWLAELAWRDFFMHILHHFPHVIDESFRPELRGIAWADDPADFDAWCAGRTGYPIVDAGMRQLVASGWMHNRVRMITASFLVKHLLVDWRWGERFFMEHLIDGDPALNNGNWQWVAGTGTDAAPYFRIFNPTAQGRRFDPAGAYVRRWLPELARVPEPLVHTPWEMPDDAQRAAGCVIGRDYPAPIVDHAWARRRALAAYRAGRG